MDRIKKYSKIIQKILLGYHKSQSKLEVKVDDEIEIQLMMDAKRHHYQVLCLGWENQKRSYFPILHLDIKDEKIWVQEAATDFDVVGLLELAGVPKSDIVLAFHAPYKRKYTGYAAA